MSVPTYFDPFSQAKKMLDAGNNFFCVKLVLFLMGRFPDDV